MSAADENPARTLQAAFGLRSASSRLWLDTVLDDFDSFLADHASCEKKASGMAMSIISHYPDKPALIRAMLNLAVEELSHYRDVIRLLLERGLRPAPERKDAYINGLQRCMDRGKAHYLRDRLLLAAIVEARGAERFGLIAAALPAGSLQRFYRAIADSETRHYELFLELAPRYSRPDGLGERLQELLCREAELLASLPPRAALH